MAQVYHSDLVPIVNASLQPWLGLFGAHGLALAQSADIRPRELHHVITRRYRARLGGREGDFASQFR